MSYTFPHKHIYLPSDDATDKRIMLLFHGTGGNEHDLIPIARKIAPGAGIFGVRGNISEQGMPRFFRRLAEGVFDEVDIHNRSAELHQFIKEAAEFYEFQTENLISVGYSNGANIATAINFLHPGLLKKNILLRPMTPLIPEVPPNLTGTSVFLSFGGIDPLMPKGEPEKLSGLYKQFGAGVKVNIEPTGHQLSHIDLEKAAIWLQEQVSSATI
jgi:phospholipase/carboxylesterase